MESSCCPACGLTVSTFSQTSGEEIAACPNCGTSMSAGRPAEAVRSNALVRVITDYGNTLFRVLVQPARFFRELPPKHGWASPLAFALVSHWIGTLSEFVWGEVFGFASRKNMQGFLAQIQDQFQNRWGEEFAAFGRLGASSSSQLDWFWAGGRVLADPFQTLVSVLVTAFWVFLGMKILVAERGALQRARTVYGSALRIVSYAWGATILAMLPMGGSWLGSIAVLFITAIGLRETYAISLTRAWVIALFPKLIVFAIIFITAVFFAAFLIQLLGLFLIF